MATSYIIITYRPTTEEEAYSKFIHIPATVTVKFSIGNGYDLTLVGPKKGVLAIGVNSIMFGGRDGA